MESQQLGPYVLIKRLGRGGMGAVYEAEHEGTGEHVAVKVLAPHLADDFGLKERFNAEIQTLKPLRCPGIVQLIAYGEDDGQPYFSMELVHGQSLERLIRGGRIFAAEEVIAFSIEIARSLKVAHDHGIIHRDLKPANLLVPDDAYQAGAQVKLADFGIAKLFGAASQTAHGSIVGTAEFMAPEQAAGKPLDARADLYTLGLVMFTMIAGKPPFRGSQLTEIITKQLREAPPRVRSFQDKIPKELDTLIDDLLAKDPAKRPASALAVGRRLTAIQDMLSQDENMGHTHGDGSPSLIIKNHADPGAPTNHDRSSSLTEASSQKKGYQDIPPAVDLFAETKAKTHHELGDSSDGALDATTELPCVLKETQPPTKKQDPSHSTSQSAQNKAASLSENPDLGNNVPIGQRLTKQATSNDSDATTSDADDDSKSTVVDTKLARRFVTVEEFDRAAKKESKRHRWQRIRVDTLVTAVTVLFFVSVAWWIIKPRTADELYQTISLETQGEAPDLRRVRAELDEFLKRFPNDDRASVVRSLQHQLRVNILEAKMRRRVLGSRVVPAIERDYRAAISREPESPSAALQAMQAVRTVHAQKTAPLDANLSVEDKETWLSLIDRQILRLEQSAGKEQIEDLERANNVLQEASKLYTQASDSKDTKVAEKQFEQTKLLLQSLIETYGERPHTKNIAKEAKKLLTRIDQTENEKVLSKGQQE